MVKNGSDKSPKKKLSGKGTEPKDNAYFREMDKSSDINVPLLQTSSDARSRGHSDQS